MTRIRTHRTLRTAAAVAGAAMMLGLAGCARRSAAPTVTVGSKNFTEQLIIAELMAQMIESHTDLQVKRRRYPTPCQDLNWPRGSIGCRAINGFTASCCWILVSNTPQPQLKSGMPLLPMI